MQQPTPRTVREGVLALVAPLQLGEPVAGLTFCRVSTELGIRLTFSDAQGERLHVELGPRGGPAAAETERLAISYRSGPLADAGQKVCRALAERIRANEESVLAAWQTKEADGPDRVREVEVDCLLEPMGEGKRIVVGEGNGGGAEVVDPQEPQATRSRAQPTTIPGGRFYGLSPYVGCVVGCRFCYAQAHLAGLRALLGRAHVEWGSWVDVRVNAPEVLARELPAADHVPIKFCPIVSDPYQALESRYDLTGRCLDVLAEHPGRRVFVLTRTTLARRDLDRLARVEATLGVSLPTLDDDVRAHFEPRGAKVHERLELLRDARGAGLRTFAVVQPMLHGDRVGLADALASHVDSVSLDVLRGEQGAAADFDDPRFARTRTASWQAEAHAHLESELAARGVPMWRGELPPDAEPVPA